MKNRPLKSFLTSLYLFQVWYMPFITYIINYQEKSFSYYSIIPITIFFIGLIAGITGLIHLMTDWEMKNNPIFFIFFKFSESKMFAFKSKSKPKIVHMGLYLYQVIAIYFSCSTGTLCTFLGFVFFLAESDLNYIMVSWILILGILNLFSYISIMLIKGTFFTTWGYANLGKLPMIKYIERFCWLIGIFWGTAIGLYEISLNKSADRQAEKETDCQILKENNSINS